MAIVLIGFQKSGKTTIGKYLALKTQENFIDLDEHILQQTNFKSIQQAYLALGEKQFREYEYQSLHYAKQQQFTIIATGGGTITIKKNRNIINSLGTVIYLKWKFIELNKKIKSPAYLTTMSLKDCFNLRAPIYESLADNTFQLDTNTPISTIANHILEKHFTPIISSHLEENL